MSFEWDSGKSATNVAKPASISPKPTIFGDPFELTKPDPEHSEGEFRFISIGLSESHHLIIVSYTERDDRIRIISARLASPRERDQYESRRTR